MSPRTGRPKSSNPKKNDLRIRMTDDEIEILNICSEKTGLNKSDVIRLGIQKVYKDVNK